MCKVKIYKRFDSFGNLLKDYLGYEPIVPPKITIKFLGNSWNYFEV